MAALLLLFLLSAIYAGDAQQRQTNITLGSSLTPTSNSSWFSPSGRFAFGFYNQTNGYAIGIYLTGMSSKTAVWTANRDNPIVSDSAVLLLNSDGGLIVQQPQAADIVIISTSQKIASASMLDNGNFVLYNSDRKVMWQSFDNPTNTILPGQRLIPGQVLFSSVSATDDSTGIFLLIMQQDGWLVQYPVLTPYLGPYAYYTEGAVGGGNNVTLNLDNDGRLYLLNSTMKIKDLSRGGGPTQSQYLMKIDVDGIFRVYSHSLDQRNMSVIWSSTTDRCSPKGICGLNGYCTQFDDKIKCECLPGFDFVNPIDQTAGCERNFTAESCKAEGGEVKYYNMRQVLSTSWENDSYAFVKTDTQNECEQACLVDCNCEVALFKDGQCSKQKLPLRFGKQDTTVSNQAALIKVGILGSTTGEIPVRETKKKELRKDILAVSISLTIFAFLVLLVTGILIQKSHAWVYKKLNENKNVQLNEEIALRAFSYTELEQATSGFTEELGRGALELFSKGL